MQACQLCRADAVAELLDFGPQPLGNRFHISPDEPEAAFPIVMGQCQQCGTVQLTTPVPPRKLVAPFDWITYNEAEGHLDDTVEYLQRLPGITPAAKVLGISYKDASTLERLRRRGYGSAHLLHMADDLGITNPCAGLETIQERLPQKVENLARKYGPADLVIARHILEHAHDTAGFLSALKRLVKPNGYILFEVPDCSPALETQDYTMLWEEHILYFTPETYQHCFAAHSLALVQYRCYPYTSECLLVAITRPQAAPTLARTPQTVREQELQRAQRFAAGLDERRQRVQRFLADFRQSGRKIAMFGAGHLACTFLSVMGIEKDIAFVVDDHPKKRGLFMPGSRLPIRGSGALLDEGIGLCLMSIRPENEEGVVSRNEAYLDLGGVFASIFPVSKRALRFA